MTDTTIWLIALAAVAVIVAVYGLVRRLLRKPETPRTAPVSVHITASDMGFTLTDAAKTTEPILWNDIKRVTMITTDQGPWLDDLFYHVVHKDGDITLPSEARGMSDFLWHLMNLPGYDAAAYATALRSTTNNSFVVVFQA